MDAIESALSRVGGVSGAARLAGDPAALTRAADAWRDQAAHLEGRATDLSAAVLRTGESWQGAASEAFRSSWEAQARGIAGLAGNCAAMASHLTAAAAAATRSNREAELIAEDLAALGAAVRAGSPLDLARALERAPELFSELELLMRLAEQAWLDFLAALATLELQFQHELATASPPTLRPAWQRAGVSEPVGWMPGVRLTQVLAPRPAPNASSAGAIGARLEGPDGGQLALSGMGNLWAFLLLLLALAMGKSLGDPVVQEKLRELRRGQARRSVAQTTSAAPQPPLKPEDEKDVVDSAREFGVDQRRVEALARDPAKGWKVDTSSVEEARVILRLEQRGAVRGAVRDPDPHGGDFIENGGSGKTWDVYSPRAANFNLDRAVGEMSRKLAQRNNVAVNVEHLSAEQLTELRLAVTQEGWADNVAFVAP